MSDESSQGQSTRAVHSGTAPAKKAINTPIYQSSTFLLDDEGYARWKAGDPEASIYTRYNNPTLTAAAQKLAALEGAEKGLVFSSGMAAIHATLLAFLGQGDRIVTTRDLYGGTYMLLTQDFPRFGIDVEFVDLQDLEATEAALVSAPTTVLHCETISNPALKVLDLPALARLAHAHGAKAIVDNTFASPLHCRPLEQGFDLVLHSVTKYLNGHSDIIGGAVVGPKQLLDQVWPRLRSFGGCMDPHQASLLERGMRTFTVRMERQTTNALEIANWLESHPRVKRVIYPGLPGHPDYALAQRVLDGPAAMVCFEVAGGDGAGKKFMDALELATQAVSLGGVESLVSMPCSTTHMHWTAEERKAVGIGSGFIRLSVGIEDFEDLRADLERALSQ
ncbi:MAG: aminotransferase class I/II-fold pyridoxal phosphate-dependent enzyme [Candidatus Poseidoniia archaeon]|nr:aminotransferase class I/II-fold pyridoxal phosphate-dependent enzyme [Candidatus Poseidoniia archaeon]